MSVPRMLLAVLPAVLAGCGDASTGRRAEPWLVEVGVAAGLDVPLTSGGDRDVKQTILEVNGNGVALVDLDGDGDLDLVLTDGTTIERWLAGAPVVHHVLLNEGVVDGVPQFAPAGDTGLVMDGWPTGVAAGDVDRDGRPDLVIGGLGEDALFLNRTEPDGPIRFEKHPLPGRGSPLDWTTSVALADADDDGRLDVYLVRYLTIDPTDPPLGAIENVPCRFHGHTVMCGPHGMPAQADVFLRGVDGPEWFEDATEAAGLADLPPSYGLGVLFTDLDGDGRPDLYVANDSVDNFVLRNRGDGTFQSRGSLSGATADLAGRAQAGMGVNVGDYDGDGDVDLVVTNFSNETNALYRNDGDLLYRDMTTAAGVGGPSTPLLGWGVHLADFDADGRLDLLFVNGHVYPEADRPGTGTSYAQPIVLMPGRDGGRFGPDAFPDPTPWVGRASVRGDLDDDGDLDLLVLRLDDRPLLYLNRTDAPQRQLVVELSGSRPHATEAFGATLVLRTADGTQLDQKLSASGFQSQGTPRLHFTGQGPILSAVVRWPDGSEERLDAKRLAFGHRVVVRQGDGVVETTPLETVP